MMLTLKNVSFSYDKDRPLLQNINLCLKQGEHIGIMGESGCGKSTLLKIINGTIPALRYKGELISDKQLTFGSIYQNLDNQIIFPYVIDELVFGMENMCYSKEMMEKKVAEVADILPIQKLLDAETSHLSGGEKQLVVMAAILCLDVDILILDECMSQVDEEGRQSIIEALKALKQAGKTVIMVDHEINNLQHVDTIYHMIEGQVKAI